MQLTLASPTNKEEMHVEEFVQLPKASQHDVDVGELLDYIGNSNEVLNEIISKIHYNGIIKVGGLDIVEVGRYIFTGIWSIDQVSEKLYGGRQSMRDITTLIETIRQYGFTVLTRRLDNNAKYYVEMKRDEPEQH